MKYIINILASISVVLNTITRGSYRNTFSARCGYAWYYERKQWAKVATFLIDTLFWFDPLHCYHEWQNEKDSF